MRSVLKVLRFRFVLLGFRVSSLVRDLERDRELEFVDDDDEGEGQAQSQGRAEGPTRVDRYVTTCGNKPLTHVHIRALLLYSPIETSIVIDVDHYLISSCGLCTPPTTWSHATRSLGI